MYVIAFQMAFGTAAICSDHTPTFDSPLSLLATEGPTPSTIAGLAISFCAKVDAALQPKALLPSLRQDIAESCIPFSLSQILDRQNIPRASRRTEPRLPL